MPTLRLEHGRFTPAEGGETEITLAAWREGARPEAGRFALVLPNDADVGEVAAGLADFSTVILDFPVFKDGRAYSQARLLRERYGYKGEIRARGEIKRDQVLFMVRAGFDGFAVDEARADAYADAIGEFGHFYQPAADGVVPVWGLRAAHEDAQRARGRRRVRAA